MATKKKFYAVRSGRAVGIFTSWDECKRQIDGYKGAIYKGFPTRAEAEAFMGNSTAATLTEAEDPRYYIYVDGSYINGEYSWGMAIYLRGELQESYSGKGTSAEASQMHNVAGEIEGAMQAALWAEAHDEQVVICYDYQGIAEWALGRWKTNRIKTQEYAQFMRKYLPLIEFKKVAGHTGVDGNELADRLAKRELGLI